MECPLPLACFQFWLKGPICLQFDKNDKRREGEKRQRRESWGSWKKVLAVVIAHLQPLAPICSSKQCALQGSVTTMLCPSWLFSLWYWVLSSSAKWGAQESQPDCGGDICPLLEPVPVCQLSSLAAACCLWKYGTSPQPRWTKYLDRKQGPDDPWRSDKIYWST